MNAPPIRVLIVEDEVIIAAALAVRLRALGYLIAATVSDAARALSVAAEQAPDVVLMDIQLNGARTGIDAAQRLREQLDIPVVFTTAYADAATLEQAKGTEPYGYLLKPYDDSSLKVAIELAVHRHRAEQDRQILQRQLLQSQKLESIGRLTSGIAHDFNNLLSIIYATSEMLELRPDRAPMLLGELRSAVSRGASLIRRLLLFSRPKSVRVDDVDVGESLLSLRKLLRRLLGPEVQLRLDTPDAPLLARIDPLHLDQLVMNLVINARDAMPDGGEVTISASAAAESWLRLSVRDSGQGIAPEHLERIFEPFFTTKAADRGTGLGLSVVRQIVQGVGGSVAVSSELGKGTTFIARLPRSAEDTSVPDEAPALPEAPRPGRRVLVVDDDPHVREVLALMLRSAGHEVTEASGVGDAISAMSSAQSPFELLLTDVMMPYIRGPVLAEALCRAHPSLKVGYISGYTGNLDGVSPLLAKPFRRDALLRFVDQLLSAP